MNLRIVYLISVALLFSLNGLAQNINQSFSFGDQFKVVNRLISPLPGAKLTTDLYANEQPGVGIAWLKNKQFTNGSIEFDVKGKDVYQQSFVGIAFHGVNDSTYEAVYFRPFNFKADDPARKSHAVQYICNPLYDWPKLRAEFPGRYEQPLTTPPDPNNWFHVRIIVEGTNVSVYANNGATPALVVQRLAQLNGKMIGCWAGNGSGGAWKNLKIDQSK